MNNYEEALKNPLYIKWIFNPTPELELYWDDFIQEHPQSAPYLLELKSKLRNIKLVNENLSEEEKLKLAYSISKRLDIEDAKNKSRRRIGLVIKYAAVAILFFSLGAIVVYLKLDKKDFENYFSKMEFPRSINSPMLILPEGQSVAINNGESTLDYSNPGEIVINKDSIINNIEPTKISQLVIPHGSSSKVVLNDGSVVWLNAGSSLVYPSVFSNKTREVVLFGEAFFSVAKNVNKPFIVQTSALEIQVLGTEFNISAYPEDNIIQTVLKEGSVAIRRKGASRNEKDIILIPNQLASFNKITRLSEVTNVNTDFYTSWTDGLLTFENRDLNRVIKSLERYYDINIQFDDPLLGSVKISGKLDLNQSKNEVFEYLSKVSSTTFVQISDNYYRIK